MILGSIPSSKQKELQGAAEKERFLQAERVWGTEVISRRVISGYSLAVQWLGLYDLKKKGGGEGLVQALSPTRRGSRWCLTRAGREAAG